MAVVPMSRVCIYGLAKDRKPVLEALQRFGVLEVAETEGEGLMAVETASMQSTFAKAADTAENALSVIESVAPEKTSFADMFAGKREIDADIYYEYVDNISEIMRIATELVSLSKDISEKSSDNARLESQIEALLPWEGLELPLNFKGTRKTSCFIGCFSGEKTVEEIIELIEFPSADVNVVSASPEQTCAVIICSKDEAHGLEERLRICGFMKPSVSSDAMPGQMIEGLKAQIEQNNITSGENEEKIKSYTGFRNALKFAYDYYNMRIEKYKTLGRIKTSKKTFMLSGFLPENKVPSLRAVLERKYNAAVESEPLGDDAPVLLKNNPFSEPVEGVIESFSMPGKGELDPTAVMSVFYYVLFGLMLADFAYGLIMALGCFFVVKKFSSMDAGLKRSLKMFMYCGISTAFWGLMFGGCFGDAVTVISSTFFGKTVNFPALWFVPLDNVMKMLIFSFAVGLVHLFTGLFMKLWQCIKNGEILDAVYDVVFWYFLVGGGIVYLLSAKTAADMLGLSPLPKTVGNVAVVFAVIGALGIILFAGRSSKNPFKRLAKGLYELYGVTSYLSDILSYSRLLALGLASGVIAQVFNKMGSMAGGGVLGAIIFIAVFIVGHTLNIGINLLGAYVHTNRLQFVEFFGKFYEGGGRLYQPFSENTKYFNIKEDF